MKSPFTEPELPLLQKMEHCGKEVLNQTSPKKNAVSLSPKPHPPSCVKAINFDSFENVKSTHNKENLEESLSSSLLSSGDFDHEVILNCGSFQEDSGYASPYQSGGVSTALGADTLFEPSPSDPKLPVLQFQRAVCKELSKGYRKTQSFDLTVIHRLSGKFGLQNVIGGKMGLEHVDVLQALLKKDMKHLLTKILRLLGDVDLVNCKKVSKAWRRIICNDQRAQRRCKEAEQRLRDSKQLGTLYTRDFAPCKNALSCIQNLASTPIQKPCRQNKGSSQKTRFREFQEAASTVKQHEALKPCRRCGSPARFDPAVCRATCTRHSCGFECCTQCQAEYHGSSTCRLGLFRNASRSKAAPLVGSVQSKRNVKRL